MITVEAAVIVPMLTILVVVCVFFFLFLLDMAAAKGEAIRSANETAAVWKTDGRLDTGEYPSASLLSRKEGFLLTADRTTLTKKAKKRLSGRLEKRVNVSKIGNCKVTIRGNTVHTRVELSFSLPFQGGKTYAGISGWKFFCNAAADLNNEEECLRKKMAEAMAK